MGNFVSTFFATVHFSDGLKQRSHSSSRSSRRQVPTEAVSRLHCTYFSSLGFEKKGKFFEPAPAEPIFYLNWVKFPPKSK